MVADADGLFLLGKQVQVDNLGLWRKYQNLQGPVVLFGRFSTVMTTIPL